MRWNLWSWKHDSHAQYTRYRAEMLVVHCAQTWAQGQFETRTVFQPGVCCVLSFMIGITIGVVGYTLFFTCY